MLYNKLTISFIFLCLFSNVAFSQLEGTAGSFSRMGFGGRGMGMGNALTAVKTGEISGYYNPASVALLKQQTVSLSYGVLALDRHLNTLFYSQPIDTNAGIALGIINSGVSNIDGRDIDGYKTETYSTSENQFSLSFALRVRSFTFGLTTKLYYYSLFKELSSTTVGFDFGIIYPLTKNLTIAGALKDFGSKYRWDTSNLYGQSGNSTIEKFPARRILGLSYTLENNTGLISAEIENSTLEIKKNSFESENVSATIVRIGTEYTPIGIFTIRGGIDGWNVKQKDQAHPSFGFTLRSGYTEWEPSVNYAYIIEPYGVSSMHIISLSIKL